MNKNIKTKERTINELKFKISVLNNDLDLSNETIYKLREQKIELNKEYKVLYDCLVKNINREEKNMMDFDPTSEYSGI